MQDEASDNATTASSPHASSRLGPSPVASPVASAHASPRASSSSALTTARSEVLVDAADPRVPKGYTWVMHDQYLAAGGPPADKDIDDRPIPPGWTWVMGDDEGPAGVTKYCVDNLRRTIFGAEEGQAVGVRPEDEQHRESTGAPVRLPDEEDDDEDEGSPGRVVRPLIEDAEFDLLTAVCSGPRAGRVMCFGIGAL